MIENTIEELTKILIKEYPNKEQYVFTKSELARFCIKLLKLIEKNK